MQETRNHAVYWPREVVYQTYGQQPIVIDTFFSRVLTDDRSGSSCPFYRRKIALCQNATTVFNGNRRQLVSQKPLSGSHKGYYLQTWNTQSGSYSSSRQLSMRIGGIDPVSTLDTEAENYAKMAFVRKANEYLMPFKGMEFLGELKESLEMIFNPAQSLRKGLQSWLSHAGSHAGKRMTRRHLNKVLADSWLEYSFGWAPLVSDIQSAVKAYDRLSKRRFEGKYIHATGFASTGSTRLETSSIAPDDYMPQRYDIYVMDDQVTKCVYRGFIKPVVYGWVPIEWRLFGFGLDRFIPTAWELLPYSWLIDYFTNIGAILEASMFCTKSVAWSNKTIRRQRTIMRAGLYNESATRSANPYLKFKDLRAKNGHATLRSVNTYRGPVTSFIPSLQFRLPRFISQVINIGAVLMQGRALQRRFRM